MKIIFQTKKLNVEEILENFASKNKDSGAVISFLGKVRPSMNKKKIKSMDIEIYNEMAMFQTKLAIESLLKKFKIHDYLIMHRYGNLRPGENIIWDNSGNKNLNTPYSAAPKMLIFGLPSLVPAISCITYTLLLSDIDNTINFVI